MKLQDAIGLVGDLRKNNLIEPAILRLAAADSEHGLSTSAINKVILEYHGPITLLRDPAMRNTITDALGKNDAASLCMALSVEAGEDPWQVLRDVKIRKNSKKESCLFDWFEIPEDQRPFTEAVEQKPSNELVDAAHGLFPHQRRAIREIRAFMNSEQPRAFLHMPTGSGKTRTAMNYICERLNQAEQSVIVWMAFNGELCEQAAEEFQRAWGHLGNRQVNMQRFWGVHGLEEPTTDGVIFVGLDKLWSRTRSDLSWLYNLAPSIDLAVFDEAHQAAAETYSLMIDVLTTSGSADLLGLSATPGRTYNDPALDAKLSDMFYRQKVTLTVDGYSSPLDYLIEEGYLSTTTFRQIQSSTTEVSSAELAHLEAEGDYSASALEQLSQDELRNLLILDHVNVLINEGHKRILVFANSVSHATLLSTYMKMRTEWPCHCITGTTPPDQRASWLSRFKSDDDDVVVLFNYGVLTTGFDAPKTTAAIVSRPTKSLVLYSQMVGRVIRGHRVGGTQEAVVMTVVDQGLPGFRDLSEAFMNWEDVWD